MGIKDRIQARFGRGGGGGMEMGNTGRRSSLDDAGADPDADIIRNMWTQKKIIAPQSPNKESWDNFLKYVAAYLSISLPIYFAFKLTPPDGHLVRRRPHPPCTAPSSPHVHHRGARAAAAAGAP